MRKLRTHCGRGHAYNDTDSYLDNRGYRRCRECRRDLELRSKANAIYRGTATSDEELAAIENGRDIRSAGEITYIENVVARLCALLDLSTVKGNLVQAIIRREEKTMRSPDVRDLK